MQWISKVGRTWRLLMCSVLFVIIAKRELCVRRKRRQCCTRVQSMTTSVHHGDGGGGDGGCDYDRPVETAGVDAADTVGFPNIDDHNLDPETRANVRENKCGVCLLLVLYTLQSVPLGFTMSIPIIVQNMRNSSYNDQVNVRNVQYR